MKIVIVGPAHPYRGGIADTNESLCLALMDMNHDASIVTFTVQYPEILFPGKSQYTTDAKPFNIRIERWINSVNPFNWLGVSRKINRMKPDLVIVRYWLPFLAPCLGTIVRGLEKDITTIAMCDNVIPHEKRFGDKAFSSYFMNSFDGFMTLSKTTYDELNEFTTNPKAFYPHPINLNLGSKVEMAEARQHLKLDPNVRYLLFFGFVRDYKGLDITLKALAEQILRDQHIQLLVVGEFYEARSKYDELIAQLGLKDDVIIIDQFVSTSEIKYYFSAANMVIQTYKTASQSGVSQLALNFECPILVTNVGGLSEIIEHGRTGYVCEKDPTEIASSILDFFKEDRRQSFSTNMIAEKSKYTWETFSTELLKLYEKLNSAVHRS